MFFILIFSLGFLGGNYLQVRKDDYKDQKIAMYEEVLSLDSQESYYFYKDPTGRIWALTEGFCTQVY